MGPHEEVPSGPLDLGGQDIADGRRLVLVRGLELVDDLGVETSRADNRPGPPIGGSQEDAAVGWLTAPAGIEDGLVEDDEVASIRALHGAYACLDAARVGVPVRDRGLHTATLSDGGEWQLIGKW